MAKFGESDLLKLRLEALDLPGRQLDVGNLPLGAGVRLVEQHPGVR